MRAARRAGNHAGRAGKANDQAGGHDAERAREEQTEDVTALSAETGERREPGEA